MRLITARTLERFVDQHADAREAIGRFISLVEAAHWTTPDAAQQCVGLTCRPIGGKRLVFNVLGNEYRIICSVRYAHPEPELLQNGILFVEWIGTHAEYNSVDAQTVTFRR